MAGLNHDFLLLSRDEYSYHDYSQFYNNSQAILLHDDLIFYISDTLSWIPCHVPSGKSRKTLVTHKGLNPYGVTIIKEGAQAAHRIFNLWADLFSNGDDLLKLVGQFTWYEEQGLEKGKYKILKVQRDEAWRNYGRLLITRKKSKTAMVNFTFCILESKTKHIFYERRIEQINGREGETATFLSRCSLNFGGLGGGFAPRHLNRSVFSLILNNSVDYGCFSRQYWRF